MDIQTLKKIDLNALVTLKVLLDEKHVTRTAQQLNLTQSAVSRTLAKLREMFGDPLLVRSGKHLSLTNRAEKLQPQLNSLLESASALLLPETFCSATHKGSIRLATTDYGTQSLLPRLVPRLNDIAPGVSLTAVDWRSNLLTELEENRVDLIIGGATEPPADIFQRIIAHDRFVAVLRKGHPYENRMRLEEYLALKHVMISPTGTGTSSIDDLLALNGHRRNISVRVPHFFTALEIIATTDMVILLPAKFVRRYVAPEKYHVLEPPFEIPPWRFPCSGMPACTTIRCTSGSASLSTKPFMTGKRHNMRL